MQIQKIQNNNYNTQFSGTLELSRCYKKPFQDPIINTLASVEISKTDDLALYNMFVNLLTKPFADFWGREKTTVCTGVGCKSIKNKSDLTVFKNKISELLNLGSDKLLDDDRFRYELCFDGNGKMTYGIRLNDYIIVHSLNHEKNSTEDETNSEKN